METISPYFGIIVLTFLAVGFLITMLGLAYVLGPKHPTKKKDDPFECGTLGTGDANQRFSVKFYLVAMIFILFDIEIVFLYPWAVTVLDIGWYSFYAILGFLTVLGFGLFYIWKRGVLDWS